MSSQGESGVHTAVRAGSRFALAAALALAFLHSATAEAHQGHLSDAPWRACDAHAGSDPCVFENDAHDRFRGTCHAMSGGLVCVRNRPIERATGDRSAGASDIPPTGVDAATMDGAVRPAGPLLSTVVLLAIFLAGLVASFSVPWRSRREGAVEPDEHPARHVEQ